MPRPRRRARGSSPGTGGRPTTTARRWSRSMPGWPWAGASAVGDVIRVNVLGATSTCGSPTCATSPGARCRINFAMVASPGLLAQRAARAHRHRAGAGRGAGRAAAGGDRRAAQCHRHPGGRCAVRDRRPAGPDRRGAGRHRVADAGWPARWCWWARWPPGQRRRTQEAVILKALGASRAQIRAAWLVEFGTAGPDGRADRRRWSARRRARAWLITSWTPTGRSCRARWRRRLLVRLAMVLVFGYAGTAAALAGQSGTAVAQRVRLTGRLRGLATNLGLNRRVHVANDWRSGHHASTQECDDHGYQS